MIEPANVNALARKREDENLKFRTFLKNRADRDILDGQFMALHNELFDGYDCSKCGNCCRTYHIELQGDEIGAIASFLALPEQDVIEKYLAQSDAGYEIKAPCCFLSDNGTCMIQECKPNVCRDFPYTDKPGRLESLYRVLSFAEQCPIVFEILERLKHTYRFKTRR